MLFELYSSTVLFHSRITDHVKGLFLCTRDTMKLPLCTASNNDKMRESEKDT